jgi:hypothetical protein
MDPTGRPFSFNNIWTNLWSPQTPSPLPTNTGAVQVAATTMPGDTSTVSLWDSFMGKFEQLISQDNFQNLTFDEALAIKELFARQDNVADFISFLEIGGFSPEGIQAGKEALQFAYWESINNADPATAELENHIANLEKAEEEAMDAELSNAMKNGGPVASSDSIKKFLANASNIPNTFPYKGFNDEAPKVQLAQRARANIFAFIENILGATPDGSHLLNLGKSPVVGWQLKQEIQTLPDQALCQIGPFQLTGKELKSLVNSTRVSYNSGNGLSDGQLCTMLSKGSKTDEERILARDRCVSSDVAMICTPNGEAISRSASQSLPVFRLYTMSAPNLSYHCLEQDTQTFFDSITGQLHAENYKQEYKKLMNHYLQECLADGVEMPIFTGFGLGAFIPDFCRAEAADAAAEAIKELLQQDNFKSFKACVFADIDDVICAKMEAKLGNMPNFKVIKKSALWVAFEAAKQKIKTGLINPGDPSCIAGQFWAKGHIALEEMLALFTTMLFAQHPHFNPLVQKISEYKKVNLGVGQAPTHMDVDPFEEEENDRFSDRIYTKSKINFTLAIPDAAGSIKEIAAVKVPARDPKGLYIHGSRINRRGVSMDLGARASLLLHGGNSLENAALGQDIAYVHFAKKAGKDQFCLNFKNANYAKELVETLKAIGFTSVEYADLEILNQFGLFKGQLSISAPKEAVFFAMQICGQRPQDIRDLLENNKTNLSIDYRSQLLLHTTDGTMFSPHYTVTPLVKASLSVPKQKILAKGVSQSVGAMTSLLIPALNSTFNAQQFKNIVNVTLNEESGLCLNFLSANDAIDVMTALKGPGLEDTYSHMMYKPINLQTKWGNYTGSIGCRDPQTIVRYLRQICRQHPKDIIDFVKSKERPGFAKTSLGAQILSLAQLPLRGEKAEDLGGKTLFVESDAVSLDKYNLNTTKLGLVRIPDLTQEAAAKDFELLNTKLQALNFDNPNGSNYIHPSMLEDNKLKINKAQVLSGMEKFVRFLKWPDQNISTLHHHYSGIPADLKDAAAMLFKIRLAMKHVIFLLDDPKIDQGIKNNLLISIAAGGSHCAGRFAQEATQAYTGLSAQSADPIYINPNIDTNLALADIQILDALEKALMAMRKSIFDKIALKAHTQFGGSDTSHTRVKCMAFIGQKFGIPGWELSAYSDPYSELAANVSQQWLEQEFNKEFNPATIVDFLHGSIKFGVGGHEWVEKLCDKTVDFFVRHCPEKYQEDPNDFLEEVIDGVNFKKSYIAQMLHYFGFIQPKAT